MLFINLKPSAVPFREAWVYSAILERTFKGGSSVIGIGRMTGLDRSRTVPKAIDWLKCRHLITSALDVKANGKDGIKWYAMKPPSDWLIHVTQGKEWWTSMGYFVVKDVSPRCPLSQFENVILWKIKNLVTSGKGEWIEAAGLASMMGVSAKRIGKALKRLAECGLIIPSKGRSGRPNYKFGDLPKDWWGKAEPKLPPVTVPLVEKVEPMREKVIEVEKVEPVREIEVEQPEDPWANDNYWGGVMDAVIREDPHNKVLRQKQAPELYQWLHRNYVDRWDKCYDLAWATGILFDARRQHSKTGESRSCIGLFKFLLQKRVNEGDDLR